MIAFSLIKGSYPQPNPRRSRDGFLVPLLGFSFSIGGWTIGPHGLSSFGGYRKQRSRTGRESTRGYCEEWQGAEGTLYNAVIYQRLSEEGVEVPGYQMSAVLNAFKVGSLITASLRTQREEEVREHGDFLITSVHSALCNCS